MAIPSKAAFESYLETCEWIIPQKIAEEIGSLTNPTKVQISSYLILLDDLVDKHHATLFKHEVDLWFDGQENFKRSSKSLFSRTKAKPSRFKSKTEYDDFRVNSIYDSYNKEECFEPVLNRQIDELLVKLISEKRVKYFLNWYLPNKRFKLFENIVRCFYNYFHTDRASEIYKVKINANNILKNVELSLIELMNLSKFEEFLNPKHKLLFGKQTKIFVSKIIQHSFNVPFERNDKTLKERVLIYDLNKVFTKYFNTPRPNAIFYLMMLEGIKNNIEKRSIERMIARWKADTTN